MCQPFHEVLDRCSSAAAFLKLQVAACNAERGCGAAAAVHEVIVSSSLIFFDGIFVFISPSVIITLSNRAHLLQSSLAMLIQFLLV